MHIYDYFVQLQRKSGKSACETVGSFFVVVVLRLYHSQVSAETATKIKCRVEGLIKYRSNMLE